MKTIDVVIGLVIDSELNVLLNRRIKEEIENINEMWELPGGKVQENETYEAAIIREIYEETKCTVRNPKLLPFSYSINRKTKDSKFIVNLQCFICELVIKGSDSTSNERKVGEIKWVNYKDLNYLDIIAGSREFLSWTLKNEHSLHISSSDYFSFIRFENVKRNRHKKYYEIQITFDPDRISEKNSYEMFFKWGRIDGKSQIRSSHYADEFELQNELAIRCAERIKNGYNIISHKSNFPLKDWLKDNTEYISTSPAQNQLNLGI